MKKTILQTKESVPEVRDLRVDNIRFLLMFLVLLGHSLELVQGDARDLIYRVIYTFHMPAFLFLTGCFARFDGKKLLRHFLLPYIILQALYLSFDALILKGEDTVTLQFTTPYWLLWYLLAVCFYYLLIPVLDCFRGGGAVVLITVGLSLLAGFDDSIGYYLTLSRFFVFLPYFTAGYCLARGRLTAVPGRKGKAFLSAAAAFGVGISIFWVWRSGVAPSVLYGSYSYAKLGYGPGERMMLLAAACCWILGLFLWIPKTRIPLLTFLGRNTFFVFAAHGFIIKLEQKYGVFHDSLGKNLLLAVLNALGIYLILGGVRWLGAEISARMRANGGIL